MKKLASFFLLFWTALGLSQDIPIGSWRSHVSYNQAFILEKAGSKIFCATENGLFSYDEESGNIDRYTREFGMSEVGITAMHFAANPGVIVIGYSSGVVDLLFGDGHIETLTTLRDAQIVADKTIREIISTDQGALLATDFGVVLLDLKNRSFKDNYRSIGPDGTDVQVFNIYATTDSVYIVTDQGIQSGSLSDNLLDFNDWVFYNETDDQFRSLTQWNDRLYSVRNESEIWEFNDGIWTQTTINVSGSLKKLAADGNRLLALTDQAVSAVLPSQETLFTNVVQQNGTDLLISNNNYWVADATNGLIRYKNTQTERIIPTGPQSDHPLKFRSVNSNTYGLFGPEPGFYNGNSDHQGYSVFKNGIWEQETIQDFYNITDVAALGENHYFTSMGFGLYDESKNLILNNQNSDLSVSSNYSDVQLTSVEAYDGALWITGYSTLTPFYKLDTEGTITTYSSSQVGSNTLSDLVFSELGIAWMKRGVTSGLIAFDPVEIQSRIFTTTDGLPSNAVNGFDITHSDEVWIGTLNGPGIFSEASYPFFDFDVNHPVFGQGFLFGNDDVRDVKTDGGDRPWFATNSGVWVFKNDLSAIDHHFTAENSPLLSDNVEQLCYNKKNGEMFILTDKGVISYRSSSSGAELVHESVITVFPNPVTPDYTGFVGISGLARNATVKITDEKGRLVKDIQANGGTASWDLRNHRGSEVQSGVYLIFSSSADGKETNVGKVAVIR